MKFSVIFIYSFIYLIIISTRTMETKKVNHKVYDSCKSTEWVVTNITLKIIGETKIIKANITYNKNNSSIYTFYIILNGCKNYTICTGEPKYWIKNVNCSNTSSDVCEAVKEMAKEEIDTNWFISRHGILNKQDLYDLVSCINLNEIKSRKNEDDNI